MGSTTINRREFLKLLGISSTSLLFGIYLNGCDLDPSPPAQIISEPTITSTPSPTPLPTGQLDPNIYLKLDSNGTITVTAFRSEMGQGVRTAIAMILAEELDADWESIVIEQAPANSAFGNQITRGSNSIKGSYSTLRIAGARVRQLLINAGAAIWEVDPGNCTTSTGAVIHPNGIEQFSYGDLVGVANDMKLPGKGEYTLKQDKDFRILGTSVHHWDAPEIITGKAIYGLDIKIPGMVFAALARCPYFKGSIESFDASKALELKGINSVQVIDNWIAVVADNTWTAIKGRDALDIAWQRIDTEINSASIRASLVERAPQLGSATDDEMDAVYEFPYQAHVTMEPMNCTAHFQGDTCEVWAPTQSPQEIQSAVAFELGFPTEKVTVHVTLMGGGFGRRLETDYAVEAAKLSKTIGKPVQIVWTRADDIQHDFYHPMHYIYVHGKSKEVKLPSINLYKSGGHVPTGAWRSIEKHPEAFAVQSFLDEIAWSQGVDPLEFRRSIYADRALAVIELAASKAGWGKSMPDGHGQGIAYFETWNTHVAMVAEVEVSSSAVQVHKMTCAIDCGTFINPDNIAAQLEGGIAFGLTAALKGGVTVEGGRILESNFHDCPILQIHEMPLVEVHIITSDRIPTGVGEVGVPPVAPAVANAVFDATGIRIRHLPITVLDFQ